MDLKEFDVLIFKRSCAKCGYGWFPRSQETKRCPKCQSWHWNEHNDGGNVTDPATEATKP